MDKRELRQLMIERRKAMSAEAVAEASRRVVDRVMGLPLVDRAEACFVYVATPGEVQTRALIEWLLLRGKEVAAPRCGAEGAMEAHVIAAMDELSPGAFGILEPGEDAPIAEAADLAIVPGLAFDRAGRRLGRGGGYYDRFLERMPEAVTIGLAFDWQLVDAVPVDDHDRPVRWVVTETEVVGVGS